MDAKLRQYLLATVVSLFLAVSGCVAQNGFGRLEVLEASDTKRQIENATIKKDVEDFRQSFEEFKKDVKDDISRHHR